MVSLSIKKKNRLNDMNKDYAKTPGSAASIQPSKPIFRTVIVIGLAMLLPLGMLYYKHVRSSHQKKHSQVQAPKKEVKPLVTASNSMQFDFYTLLPKMNVETPPANNTVSPSLPIVRTASPSASTADNYVLQVAAFHALSDAQKLNSQLLAVDSHLYIQKIKINDELWYRVLIGPFDSFEKVNSVQSRLKQQGLPSILIKIPANMAAST
jgi:cell division protein FtsN